MRTCVAPPLLHDCKQDFFFDAIRDADGYLAGIVRLDLYDENKARQDELVGTVDIDLSEIPPEAADPRGQQQIAFYDYPVSYKVRDLCEPDPANGPLPAPPSTGPTGFPLIPPVPGQRVCDEPRRRMT